MSFTNPAFILSALAATIFTVAGVITLKFPPRKINWIYGYRTSSSMKSQEKWDFAQHYSAKEMIRFGVILFLISLLILFFTPEQSIGSAIIGPVFLVIFIIALLARTERAIKKKFNT
jgi:uncharacterized membrane protein